MSDFSFVPNSLFDNNQANSYLPTTKSRQRRAYIVCHNFDYFGVVGIFDHKGKADNYCHPLCSLIRLADNIKGENILSQVIDNKLHLIAVKDNSLLLANTFNISKDEDIAYFILSAIQNTALNIDEVNVKIDCTKSPTLMPLIGKYANVEQLSF